jgi:hypothetical protein
MRFLISPISAFVERIMKVATFIAFFSNESRASLTFKHFSYSLQDPLGACFDNAKGQESQSPPKAGAEGSFGNEKEPRIGLKEKGNVVADRKCSCSLDGVPPERFEDRVRRDPFASELTINRDDQTTRLPPASKGYLNSKRAISSEIQQLRWYPNLVATSLLKPSKTWTVTFNISCTGCSTT